jgi:phosphohistidine phosphatase SixA
VKELEMKTAQWKILATLFVATVMSQTIASEQAPALSGDALATALQHGGYVLVMRHASSPRELPTQDVANPDNVKRERQLDAAGRAAATAMGTSLRAMKIPVGTVLSSPTYRALETARLAQLERPRSQDELGDGGQSMQSVADTQAAWLRRSAMDLPRGTNTIIITHLPNITSAFPSLTPPPADGETLVFGPDGQGSATVIARIKIDDWPSLRR